MAAIKRVAAAWKARADAGLNAREQAELQAWLEADTRHRAALARFDLVWDKFDRPFQAGATDELLRELGVRARRRRRRQRAAAASVLVLTLAAAVWGFSGRLGSRATMVAEHVSPTNAVLLLPERRTLPDGSVAELKPGARIRVDFSPEVRRVALLQGEVHFQVTKNPARPFIVAADGVEAQAVGTAFSVKLQPSAVEVLVTEGRVSVNQTRTMAPDSDGPVPAVTPAAPAPLAVLDVGKRIVVDLAPQSAPARVTSVQPEELDECLAWRAPRVEFTRTSLAEAVTVLNGYFAGRRSLGQPSVQFIIADPALNDVRVSGLFRVDRTEAFVRLLKSGFGIEAERRDDDEILLRRAP
jgi:transmembrane sensor